MVRPEKTLEIRLDSALLRELVGGATGAEADAIAALLEQVIADAIAAHPGLPVAPAAFARHLISKLPPGAPLEGALLALRAADLYLAFACAAGDAAALALFEETFASEFAQVAARARGRVDADDFRQVCRERLFARERPKIADYSGQGDLRGFLRVTLVRVLIDLTRKRTEAGGGDDTALQLPDPGADPELGYLKRLYRSEFKQAFEDAALALDPEDRNVLRYHFAHGLTIDQLATVYNVHRATAARRIARARDELLAGTRRHLMARLRLNRDELDSVMRMIESDVHVSVHRVFGGEPPKR